MTKMNDSCWYYAGHLNNIYKVVLEPAAEGTYIFVYMSEASDFPELDYLQDDLDGAKRFCRDEFKLNIEKWQRDARIDKLMD